MVLKRLSTKLPACSFRISVSDERQWPISSARGMSLWTSARTYLAKVCRAGVCGEACSHRNDGCQSRNTNRMLRSPVKRKKLTQSLEQSYIRLCVTNGRSCIFNPGVELPLVTCAQEHRRVRVRSLPRCQKCDREWTRRIRC